MRHIRHNTGRLYTSAGQVIWIRLDRENHKALFYDLSRGIDGWVPAFRDTASDREVVDHVIHCYDLLEYGHNQDSWSFGMSSEDPNGAYKLERKFTEDHPELSGNVRGTWGQP